MTFQLNIVTPDGEFYNGEAERIIVRTIDGDVCIMPRHTYYVTALATGVAQVTIDSKKRQAACSGGVLTVRDDNVRLCATTFEWDTDIDADRAERAKTRAEQLVSDAKTDEDLCLAKAKLSRALTRIDVAK
jgi:F-type H+-transporting ATPase subunit epsilon